MKKNLFKLIGVILTVTVGLCISYYIIKMGSLDENTKKEVKNTKKIETESKKVLYAYFVPKISEADFNMYYEKKEDINYVNINKISDINITDDSIYEADININEKSEDNEEKNDIKNNEEEIGESNKKEKEEDSNAKDELKESEESKEDSKTEVKEVEVSNGTKQEVKENDEINKTKEEISKKDKDNSSIEKELDGKDAAEDKTLVDKEFTSLSLKNEVQKKNGFIEEDENKYYYQDDIRVTGVKNIGGINHYFTSNGVYLGTNNIKVIDVSYHQGKINWDMLSNSNMIYGVILRIGYYNTMDKLFIHNLNELKRLNISYGIYLYSYATTVSGAKKEADFVSKAIKDYNVEPTLGIFYDLEGWKTKKASSNTITKGMYDRIANTFVNNIKSNVGDKYKIGVYSGRWYAMNRFGALAKSYVNWVAEYNKTCKYDGNYFMWQYTSKGKVPGINGNVDISYIL